MRRLLSPGAALLVLGACAAPAGDGGIWSQRPEERGRLPIGRVVAVQLIEAREPRPLATSTSAGSIPGAGVSADTAGVIAATGGSSAGALYRYALRMSGGDTRLVEAEQTFRVGDCIALRTDAAGRASIVTALAEECR